MYAGTIDRTGRLNSKKVLIDIKTGSPHPATDIQLAAYEELLDGGAEEVYALYLRDNGSYSLIKKRDNKNFAVFRSALHLYYYKKEHLNGN